MNDQTAIKKIKEIDILDIFKKFHEISLKYKKIIITSFVVSAILGSIIGIKLEKNNQYYSKSIKFNQLDTKTGLNLDGTKLDINFFSGRNENIIVTLDLCKSPS